MQYGVSFLNGTKVTGEVLYRYPNEASARFVRYHDHAMGITRLNAYAELASAYILRNAAEFGLISSKIIPSRKIPLIIQDKTFVSQQEIDNCHILEHEEHDMMRPLVVV